MTALSRAAEDYLGFRRAFGHDLGGHARLLREFVGYLDRQGAATVTTGAAVAWASAPARSCQVDCVSELL